MPNWCNNSITITGPKDKITALYREAVKGEVAGEDTGLLHAMMPMPTELNDTTSPSEDGNDWYSWRVNNWGTKWEVSSEGLELSEDGTEITGWFDSAWAPPLGAFSTFLESNEDCSLTCYYEEPGMDFAGKFSGSEGVYDDEYLEGIQEICEHYVKTGEYPTDELFRDIDEYFDLVEQRREWIEEELDTVELEDMNTQGSA